VNEDILVLTAGGTIDKQYFDALSAYQITNTMVGRLLELGRVTRSYRVKEILRKDSLDMTLEDRERLVEEVRGATESRIVVTHGTDTMTDTAKVLSVFTHKTIVLTGALTPARFSDSDASFNIGMAFAAAQLASPGVYIAINGSVFGGDEVVKDREVGGFVLR
jgi:L-asparaginase